MKKLFYFPNPFDGILKRVSVADAVLMQNNNHLVCFVSKCSFRGPITILNVIRFVAPEMF